MAVVFATVTVSSRWRKLSVVAELALGVISATGNSTASAE